MSTKIKLALFFILGMLTFAVGYFILNTFVFVERPSRSGVIEDWERICFWLDESGMVADVSPRGCYSTSCARPVLQSGSAVVDQGEQSIIIESRFIIEETSRFPLPCVENCAGGGTVQFNLGGLIPNTYRVWFRDKQVGELEVYSGRPTPRQCFEQGSRED